MYRSTMESPELKENSRRSLLGKSKEEPVLLRRDDVPPMLFGLKLSGEPARGVRVSSLWDPTPAANAPDDPPSPIWHWLFLSIVSPLAIYMCLVDHKRVSELRSAESSPFLSAISTTPIGTKLLLYSPLSREHGHDSPLELQMFDHVRQC